MQTVLDYRAEQLNRVQQKVAEEEHKRLLILQRIQEADQLIEQSFQEQSAALHSTSFNPIQFQNFPNYLFRLKQMRFQEFQNLQLQDRKLLIMRDELKQAHIKKKALDILKEKDQIRYRQNLEKAEEEMMAEIALNRTYRQGASC